jgi:hypothetical protein
MPKGIVNITSKNTNDQTEPIENIPQKSVLTKAPTINPKTKLKFNKIITCTNKKYRNVD